MYGASKTRNGGGQVVFARVFYHHHLRWGGRPAARPPPPPRSTLALGRSSTGTCISTKCSPAPTGYRRVTDSSFVRACSPPR
eukprot:gene1091-biopygen18237